MKVLVTGGAGYIGSVLIGYLLEKGYSVTALDNLYYGTQGLYQYCSNDRFEFVRGDARDESVMRDLIASHDVLIPLAAIVGMPACARDPLMAKSTNYDAIALLNHLRSPDQPVIYPCTNSGYGTKFGDVYCTEDTPLEPISIYGTTKVDAEKLLLDSPQTITLRLATVFGPSARMRLDLLVNDFTYRAVTDRSLVLYEAHFMRNYVHVQDVARAFCYALGNFNAMKGEPYNVGLDSANLSKLELAERIKKYVPQLYIHCAEIGTDPDKRNYIVSNEKIRKAGFEAQHSLDEGIQQLLKAFRLISRDPLANV